MSVVDERGNGGLVHVAAVLGMHYQLQMPIIPKPRGRLGPPLRECGSRGGDRGRDRGGEGRAVGSDREGEGMAVGLGLGMGLGRRRKKMDRVDI
jgi:hypothetical protein